MANKIKYHFAPPKHKAHIAAASARSRNRYFAFARRNSKILFERYENESNAYVQLLKELSLKKSKYKFIKTEIIIFGLITLFIIAYLFFLSNWEYSIIFSTSLLCTCILFFKLYDIFTYRLKNLIEFQEDVINNQKKITISEENDTSKLNLLSVSNIWNTSVLKILSPEQTKSYIDLYQKYSELNKKTMEYYNAMQSRINVKVDSSTSEDLHNESSKSSS